ncbi:DeoR/GlpR family DNA-binding transcription regulator [Lactobacillus sp. ESL0791]|uniref:DeoR/GlpR family DNA-binding transcription regulator n=1 Tax=Lactobacillus sp. ESL0791 TaxID=2983234 RepID=UPI0023F65BC0|nr:DeoR/GlpR family DNA-binding transcription regulator [Lactobacillus sp. ESL0791]MDF7638595.1 DeoR/GlpR family DNA-binding transcription regulator [Lactobacillus sp. ESL0791]
MNLSKADRLQKIINILAKNKKISTKKLQEQMNASVSTLRRDLLSLQATNTISHTHGYVSLLENSNVELAYSTRRSANVVVKNKLCKCASELIINGSAIFLDGSSTLTFLPKYFAGKTNIHVITNNINIADEVSQLKNIDISVIGGQVSYRSNSILGPKAINDLTNNYRPNLSFLSCSSIDEFGIYMTDENETAMKQAAINSAKKSIFLIDHTKFGKNDYIFLSDFNSNNIQTIITDRIPPEKIQKSIEKSGINLIITNEQ